MGGAWTHGQRLSRALLQLQGHVHSFSWLGRAAGEPAVPMRVCFVSRVTGHGGEQRERSAFPGAVSVHCLRTRLCSAAPDMVVALPAALCRSGRLHVAWPAGKTKARCRSRCSLARIGCPHCSLVNATVFCFTKGSYAILLADIFGYTRRSPSRQSCVPRNKSLQRRDARHKD
jgi:hypothetical protein